MKETPYCGHPSSSSSSSVMFPCHALRSIVSCRHQKNTKQLKTTKNAVIINLK